MEVPEGKGIEVQKHLALFDSMNGHRSVLNRLATLVGQIEGSAQSEEDKPKVATSPSLKEFLLNAPEQMGVMTDILSTQIDKIEENLF